MNYFWRQFVTQTFESSNFINEIGEFFKKNNTMY